MTTNTHPAHGPVSLDRLHQIREILSKASAQSDGGNLGYAMADAVKVIDGAIAAFGAEPVAWLHSDNGIGIPAITRSRNVADSWFSKGWNIKPLYTTPPASKPMKDHQIRELVNELRDIAIEYHGTQQLRERIVRAVRAAMLQAGNHTEQHLDMVDHSGYANEKVDCRLTFDQWLSQQNEPIDVDCGCVTTEAFYHWLRVAYEAGNSPVAPDCWKVEAERLAEIHGCSFVVFRQGEEPQCADPTKVIISFTDEGLGHHSAAPQQEVKRG
ncbi:hypothetical protein SJ593_00720 [Citrobacter freundii]|uniref:hypothetical protein n=1 Tax=Citrobacter freundii TaxID=546 RepID=UPI001FFDEEA8|nr:hypothetical protein [Citrobacter freundii]MDX7501417.1 hypothetical protein [Citrobacter freundii]